MSGARTKPTPGELLETMFASNSVADGEGAVTLKDALSREHAEALYCAILDVQPRVVIEVGMAYAASTLAILEALRVIGSGRLISIDPMQMSHYSGLGVRLVQSSSMADTHTLDERFDYEALPALLAQGTKADFGYIDGWHTFDYALLDFFYLDKLLRVGGVVGFNDCYMVGINKVIRYVQTHRDYSEIDVGLRVRHGSVWRGRNPAMRAIRALLDIGQRSVFPKELEQRAQLGFLPARPAVVPGVKKGDDDEF